jgi:hypothetical protein
MGINTSGMSDEEEDKQWSMFSASQLTRQYSPQDAIYDDELADESEQQVY